MVEKALIHPLKIFDPMTNNEMPAKQDLSPNDIKAWVYTWFAGFDHQRESTFFEQYLPEEGVHMHFPDGTIRSRAEFVQWYAGVQKTIAWNSHDLYRLDISGNQQSGWTVELDLHWEAQQYDGGRISQDIHQSWRVILNADKKLVLEKHQAVVNPLTDIPLDNLKALYTPLCESYQKVDDFRAKLLGFLPLASGVTILGLLHTDAQGQIIQHLPEIGVFGALITFALLIYELKGIQKCTGFIYYGQAIEKRLLGASTSSLIGQFTGLWNNKYAWKTVTEPVASALIYATVLAAWIYVACSQIADKRTWIIALIITVLIWVATVVGVYKFWRNYLTSF